MWAQATKVTALKIELAGGCGGDPQVLCGDDRLAGDRDALVISDETIDNDAAWNKGPQCQTVTTVGYRYSEQDRPYRHSLKFCSFGPDITDGDKANAIRAMAHELGTSSCVSDMLLLLIHRSQVMPWDCSTNISGML